MTSLDNIKKQVNSLPREDKQELRFFINQNLRESNMILFRRRDAMRQIQAALSSGYQF